MKKHNKKVGKFGEEIAAKYLIDKGHEIKALNYHKRFGEIDIISEIDKFLVFTEVKTRKALFSQRPIEAIDSKKISKILKTSEYYYCFETDRKKQPRFDVIEITMYNSNEVRIKHIENAF